MKLKKTLIAITALAAVVAVFAAFGRASDARAAEIPGSPELDPCLTAEPHVTRWLGKDLLAGRCARRWALRPAYPLPAVRRRRAGAVELLRRPGLEPSLLDWRIPRRR